MSDKLENSNENADENLKEEKPSKNPFKYLFKLDRNNDGKVDENDFIHVIINLLKGNTDELKEAINTIKNTFKEMDSNGNGRLEIKEALAGFKIIKQLLADGGKQMMEELNVENPFSSLLKLDKNGDGKITQEDFVLCLLPFGSKLDEIREAFKKMDTNEDGKLDMTESLNAYKILKEMNIKTDKIERSASKMSMKAEDPPRSQSKMSVKAEDTPRSASKMSNRGEPGLERSASKMSIKK